MFLSRLFEKGAGVAGSALIISSTRCIYEDSDSSLVFLSEVSCLLLATIVHILT